MPIGRVLLIVAAMGCVTFFTRAVPFLFFRGRTPPKSVLFICNFIPPAVMTILALSSFKEVHFRTPPFGAPEVLAALVVAALHLWKRNAFISIFAGTAFYLLLTRSGLGLLVLGG